MASADYRFYGPPKENDYESEAFRTFEEKGITIPTFRKPGEESLMPAYKRYKAAIKEEGKAIKESRDPKLEKEKQLKAREASFSKADEALKKEGLNPQDFWASEPGLSKKSFTDRTGKKIAIPEKSRVEAMSREIETPDGGAVRQIAGLYGYGSTKLSPEGVAKLQAQRDREFTFASNVERAKQLRAEREKAAGAAATAKLEKWESDKQAYAEGQQVQRDANKQLALIRRAEINRGRAVRAGTAAPFTPEQYIAMQDEKAALQNTINAREGLNKKGITEAGYDARARRRQQVAEQAALREAEIQKAKSASTAASTSSSTAPIYDPYSDSINKYYEYLFGPNSPFSFAPTK